VFTGKSKEKWFCLENKRFQIPACIDILSTQCVMQHIFAVASKGIDSEGSLLSLDLFLKQSSLIKSDS
jgi:hypothetical protein